MPSDWARTGFRDPAGTSACSARESRLAMLKASRWSAVRASGAKPRLHIRDGGPAARKIPPVDRSTDVLECCRPNAPRPAIVDPAAQMLRASASISLKLTDAGLKAIAADERGSQSIPSTAVPPNTNEGSSKARSKRRAGWKPGDATRKRARRAQQSPPGRPKEVAQRLRRQRLVAEFPDGPSQAERLPE